MIGIFDSGLGGLAILQALVTELPQYAYLYLADSARAPYGNRDPEDIYTFTCQGLTYLFDHGCELVILGCNTASAVALRRIQQEFLPQSFPDRRVLGILVPTVEQISGVGWNENKSLLHSSAEPHHVIGVLATQQTVASGAYEREIHKRNPGIRVIQQACPELVPLIEQGTSEEEIKRVATHYVQALLTQVKQSLSEATLEAVLLGCTHYSLVSHLIASLLPPDVILYEQPTIVAQSLKHYLERHPEFKQKHEDPHHLTCLTTGDPQATSHIGSRFYGKNLAFEKINLH